MEITAYEVREARPDEFPVLVETSCLAFTGDPLMRWLDERDGSDRCMLAAMASSDLKVAARRGIIHTVNGGAGNAIWYPPGAKQDLFDRIELITSLLPVMRLTRRMWAKVRLFRKIIKIHPGTPHYYLSQLAVHPGVQSRGLGTALLRPVLAVCDREGIPAYLETQSEKNVGFYQKSGFAVRETFTTSDVLLLIWTM